MCNGTASIALLTYESAFQQLIKSVIKRYKLQTLLLYNVHSVVYHRVGGCNVYISVTE